MKKTCWISIFFCILFNSYAQDYDLIVTIQGDSIACNIDSIADAVIYFEMKYNNNWVNTSIYRNEVANYEYDTINRKLYVFRQGSSYIESPRPVSIRGLPRNSVYAGAISINYSRLIPGDRLDFTVAGGFQFAVPGLQAETTMLIGRTKHYFEPGIMVYHSFMEIYDELVRLTMIRLGYRYQGPKGFLIRIVPMLVWDFNIDDLYVMPAGSILMGYSF